MWELMEEVSVYSNTISRSNEMMPAASGAMINALPVKKRIPQQQHSGDRRAGVKKPHRRGKGDHRRESSSGVSVISAYSTRSCLGDNWRFLVDALSLHPQNRHHRGIPVQFRTDRTIIPSNVFANDSIAVSNDVLENTEVTLSNAAAISSSSEVSGSTHKDRDGRRQRGGQNRSVNGVVEAAATSGRGDVAAPSKPKAESSQTHKTPIKAMEYLLAVDVAHHYCNIPEPQRFAALLRLHIDGKLNPNVFVVGLTVCIVGVRAMIDGDADGALLSGFQLRYITRFPWVLDDVQALNYVNDCLDEQLGDEDDGNAIVLNRFTDPSVWVEAIVQQLSAIKKGVLTILNCCWLLAFIKRILV